MPDHLQRKTALDINQSFIVQAPAGSGKTTLLVKRFLALLSKANDPGEILAITFTKKAAHEMQNRILSALKNPDSLAAQVLAQDQLKNWQLRESPHKLRIQTIDALCNYLARLAPFTSQLPVTHTISPDTKNYYRQAALAMLQHLEASSPMSELLLHLDNDWNYLENLFIAMLECREQWLPYIVGLKKTQALKPIMEAGLAQITEEAILKCTQYFPKDLYATFHSLATFAATNLATEANWQFQAKLLLTEDYHWRKRVDKNQGFPASCPEKQQMMALLQKLAPATDLRKALQELLLAPPISYSETQWQIIVALLELLPLLAAELKVVLQEAKVTDYAEVAMAALRSFGDEDTPSNLALYLDNKIKHLLVDEFQDTSLAQLELINKITAGWQPGDGRTLFLVGDPMQSIYRFRNAEVGLFNRTCTDGIGAIKLTKLQLTNNFRTTQTIIKWLNTTFKDLFPPTADVAYGAVPFTPSDTKNVAANSGVHINLVTNGEPQAILTTLQKIQEQYPNDSIAILVKARNHLQTITPVLNNAGITYQAIDLETLSEDPCILDLFTLTRAILHPGDRIAWLALLRAPWCGLCLQDLHTIAQNPIIPANILNYQKLQLTLDAQRRLQRIQPIVVFIQQNRARLKLRDLVEHTWLSLGGPACITEADLANANLYFELLEQTSPELPSIQNKLATLYLPPKLTSKIQIMTIHKAKGLEFDHVIIPSIDKSISKTQQKLLLWTERPRLHGGKDLLLAPISDKKSNSNDLYKYLQNLEQQKAAYENCRLLYVAATRAKSFLYLFGGDTPKHGSFLAMLQKTNLQYQVSSIDSAPPEKPHKTLFRLPTTWQHPCKN